MDKSGLKASVFGRPKSISSIWNKMRKKEVEFDDVYDKFAIRVILDSLPEKKKKIVGVHIQLLQINIHRNLIVCAIGFRIQKEMVMNLYIQR
jgi:(p)ppGpp synthase/HD superfamily hydrolase